MLTPTSPRRETPRRIAEPPPSGTREREADAVEPHEKIVPSVSLALKDQLPGVGSKPAVVELITPDPNRSKPELLNASVTLPILVRVKDKPVVVSQIGFTTTNGSY